MGLKSPVKRTEPIPSGSMERIHCQGWEGGRPHEALREEPQQELAAGCWRAKDQRRRGGGWESPQAGTGSAGATAGTAEGAAVLKQ